MKEILKEISQLAFRLPYNDIPFTDEQKQLDWLGNSPPALVEIETLEKKLQIIFPKDYKDFLLITNGFTAPTTVEPSFSKLNKVDFLKSIDPFLVDIWMEGSMSDIGIELSRSILIGGISEEQYFLLIPPSSDKEQWKYWKFANWIPGEESFDSLKHYFTEVLNFIKDAMANGNYR